MPTSLQNSPSIPTRFHFHPCLWTPHLAQLLPHTCVTLNLLRNSHPNHLSPSLPLSLPCQTSLHKEAFQTPPPRCLFTFQTHNLNHRTPPRPSTSSTHPQHAETEKNLLRWKIILQIASETDLTYFLDRQKLTPCAVDQKWYRLSHSNCHPYASKNADMGITVMIQLTTQECIRWLKTSFFEDSCTVLPERICNDDFWRSHRRGLCGSTKWELPPLVAVGTRVASMGLRGPGIRELFRVSMENI